MTDVYVSINSEDGKSQKVNNNFYRSRTASLRDKSLTGAQIAMLLLLIVIILSMMPRNVWGEEIYMSTDKDGTIAITNKPPPQENINSDTKKNSNSYQDSTEEERLHWGRDNALIDEQKKGKNRQRKTAKDSGSIDAGRYKTRVMKIGSNLYQDIYTRNIIKTRDCVELADMDEALLDWSGVSGELFFQKKNKSCVVKKIYK